MKLTQWVGMVGMIIAAIVSYEHWHSVGWATLHCFCGWLYLLYQWSLK